MFLRRILIVLLALMLGFTSQSIAVARGAAAAAGQIVLCTGTGPVAVYTDAQGQPTNAPYICPDSGLNVIAAGPTALVTAPARIIAFDQRIAPVARSTPAYPHPAPPPRGPPVAV